MAQKMSKKNVQKKQNQAIEDRTFGLKNKNKSSKVQKFIQQVEVGVKNSNNSSVCFILLQLIILSNNHSIQKSSSTKSKTQIDEETRILLEEGLANPFGKKKTKTSDGKTSTEDKQDSSDEEEENSSEESESEDEIIAPPPVMEVAEAVLEGDVVYKEKTLEDMIEEQRAKLAAQGKTGTPVTAETFALWRAAKLAKRQAEAEARMRDQSLSKKKGGKGCKFNP